MLGQRLLNFCSGVAAFAVPEVALDLPDDYGVVQLAVEIRVEILERMDAVDIDGIILTFGHE
jgi:hypothetical protein